MQREPAASRSRTIRSRSPARGSPSPDVTTLDDALDRLEALDEDGDRERLRAELDAVLARFPDAPEGREWEASRAVDDARFETARALLDSILAAHPHRGWARRERAAVLLDLGRCQEALEAVRGLPHERDPAERASIHHDIGRCLDRLGSAGEADAEFRRAAHLAPDEF